MKFSVYLRARRGFDFREVRRVVNELVPNSDDGADWTPGIISFPWGDTSYQVYPTGQVRIDLPLEDDPTDAIRDIHALALKASGYDPEFELGRYGLEGTQVHRLHKRLFDRFRHGWFGESGYRRAEALWEEVVYRMMQVQDAVNSLGDPIHRISQRMSQLEMDSLAQKLILLDWLNPEATTELLQDLTSSRSGRLLWRGLREPRQF